MPRPFDRVRSPEKGTKALAVGLTAWFNAVAKSRAGAGSREPGRPHFCHFGGGGCGLSRPLDGASADCATGAIGRLAPVGRRLMSLRGPFCLVVLPAFLWVPGLVLPGPSDGGNG